MEAARAIASALGALQRYYLHVHVHSTVSVKCAVRQRRFVQSAMLGYL